MSIESSLERLPFEQVEGEVSRVAYFTYDLYDLRAACQSVPEEEERELLLEMCDDLAETSRRYVKLVAAFYAGTASNDHDARRRIAHNSIISSLTPLIRRLRGNFEEKPPMEGGLSNGNRIRIGEWALVQGLDILRGEELQRVKPR